MAPELSTPTVAELPTVVAALGEWQDDGVTILLHPGDVGWFARAGAAATAAALRTNGSPTTGRCTPRPSTAPG